MQKIYKSIIFTGLFLSELTFFISFTGCSSSPTLIETYPDFLNRKDHISSISMCTDVLVVYDGVEPGVVIDIPLSLIVGDSILSIFRQELEKKNYRIGKIYPTAVGYSLRGDEQYYRVFETREDYSLSTDSLRTKSAPFVIQDKFLDIENLLNKADKPMVAGSGGNSSSQTERAGEGEYLLYCYLEATNVSLTKRIGEGLLITLITLGNVTTGPEAVASASYELYDLRTGNIVLSDGRTMTGPDINGNNIADLLEEMLEEIPAKEL